MAEVTKSSNTAEWPREGLTLELTIERSIGPLDSLRAAAAAWLRFEQGYRVRRIPRSRPGELPVDFEDELRARRDYMRELEAIRRPFRGLLATSELLVAVRPLAAFGAQLQPLRPDDASLLEIKVVYPANSLTLYDPNDRALYGLFWAKQVAPEAMFSLTTASAANPIAGGGPGDMSPDPFRTGAAGRPSAAGIVVAEAQRRINNGQAVPSQGGLTKFSEELADWWDKERKRYTPHGPPLTASGIKNNVRELWNAAVNERPKL